ncbi:hypothetical protein PF002_g10112 [Phytophthora fragariae]|uniref:Secreted protein n=1 Tax=Phytophthora fragariae TaxID=53985 RepID=A0A6A3ZUB3_9STRA|nr:hypothetical protein PF007_g9119 [Phytophthora fragariae]KAE9239775.1 hypothetical protein PF002_g10112 [Phytophthora fragariae]
MSLLLATLYYCLLSLPICACPYFCRACTTVLQPDLRGVIKILPRRVLVVGVRVGAFCSAGFAGRGLGSARFTETGVLVDSSDDYASHWILAPCLTAHHPCRISRRAVAPIKRVAFPQPRRSPSLTSVDIHLGAFFLRRPACPPTSSAGYYTTWLLLLCVVLCACSKHREADE